MQETIEVTTPVLNKLVVLRGYQTGRIEMEIKSVLEKGMKLTFDADSGEAKPSGTLDPSVMRQANLKAIELMVVSVDGSDQNVTDAVLDMPSQDTDFVIAKINEVTSGMSDEKKGASSSNPTDSPQDQVPA